MKRKISALLAADIVKYSRLVADAEEETVRRLAAYRTIFEEAAARHGGRIVNMVGDAVLAEFASSVDAVRCALDVQAAARASNAAFPPERHMRIRIGVSLADIMDRDGELFGDGVNITARLESLSPAGAICVSQTVREQVAGKIEATFIDIGEQQVKNLPNPIHAYVIAQPEAEAPPAKKTARPRRGRMLAGAAVGAAACVAAAFAAVQLRGERAPASADAAPPQLASVGPASRFDLAKLRTLAKNQSIPLPPRVPVLMPASAVPAAYAGYLGAWGGDKRWNDRGRQAILVVERVEEDGTAVGIYAHGVPQVTNEKTQNSARFVPFAASVNEKGLHFTWERSSYTFLLLPDGSMWGRQDSDNTSGHHELSIVLQRIE
ncbi:MAG TPA: adenylate/guanylate cyclase domain-containing protein [Xanthobacteraceae bacterium]|jgi:adenylate cyclase|nr:adenylate/guanylate cyclase domain-containing protein [Xanthobacteraceae bacterium]